MFLTPADYIPGVAFRRKLELTVETLVRVVPEGERIGVAFSGGKDSCVVLHLLRRLFGEERVVAGFYDSGLELPQTKEFVSQWDVAVFPLLTAFFEEPLASTLQRLHEKNWKEWQVEVENRSLLEAERLWEKQEAVERERLTLVDLLEYGGYWGCETAIDTTIEFPFEEILVKYPSKLFRDRFGFRYLAIGLRADESTARTNLFKSFGIHRYSEADALHYLYPLAHWSCEDVCHYLAVNSVPYHPSYDLAVATKRPRCAHRVSPLLGLCGWEYGRLAYTFLLYPDIMRYLCRKFPALRSFRS